MASQDLKDRELLLTHVPVQLSQLLKSGRRLRDDEHPFECHIQPRLDFGPQ